MRLPLVARVTQGRSIDGYVDSKNRTIAVIVPAFNEEKLIGPTLATIPDIVTSIFVVDDRSTDHTVEQVLASPDPRVRLIRHDRNVGVGGAIMTGHRAAADAGHDVMVVMAGDNQMPADYLEVLVAPVLDGRADFAKGNRFADKEALSSMPNSRRFGSVVLTWMTRVVTGYWHLHDVQNGYTAISRSALSEVNPSNIAERYSFENTVLMEMSRVGARVVDVPIPAVYGSEVSGMQPAVVGPQIVGSLLRGWPRLIVSGRRGSRFVVVTTVVGVIATVFGVRGTK